MNSAERVPLNWRRPPEWEAFLSAVEETHSATTLYGGFEIERAWREYREQHPAEEYTDRLLSALGRREKDAREKNRSTREAGTGGDRVGVRVRQGVEEEMAAYADELGVPNHEVLRSVVCWYLDGGLLGLLTDKLERAVPEAEKLADELGSGNNRGLTAKEKKRRWLADELPAGGFDRDDFGGALEAMPYRGGDTEHMRETHLQPVRDRLGYTEHPNQPGLFIPEEKAREYADEQGIDPDAPAIDRKDYADLSDDERVYGLRLNLARRAAERSTGKYAFRVGTVREEVFDGTPGTRKVKTLMDRAARAEGFDTDAKGGTKRLRCDLSDVPDPDILEDADLADTVGTSGVDDDGQPEDLEAEATEKMDRIEAGSPAHAVTDGGERT